MSLHERPVEIQPETTRLAAWAVRMCRRRMPGRWFRANLEDIYQIARIKAWEAQRDWRPGGRQFDSFVLLYVERALLREVRDWGAWKRGNGDSPLSFEDVRNEAGECITDSLFGDAGDHLHPLLVAEDARLIGMTLRYLEPVQRYAVEQFYLAGLTHVEAAVQRGCSTVTQRQACYIGVQRLRELIGCHA